ncbi:MAG: hypothetical protein GY751_04910, partial [Bacteroidetes bacterium]|nr:hypothetical protein [Bacteroidota bacterium]
MKRLLTITTFLLIIGIAFAIPPTNDDSDQAIDVTSLVASNGGTWCSADDAITYSNMDATPDGAESSCKA